MSAPATSDCTICQPPELATLLSAEHDLATHWRALPRRRFTAGSAVQRAGEASTLCWQVQSGVVRLYYLNEQGTERNRSFHGAGSWVAGSMPPLVLPSPYAIEALADTEAVELSYATLQQWQQRFPRIQPLLEEALGYQFRQHAQREAELLSEPPEARYQSFLATQGELAQRLPLHHVASYLGISPVSLSRIRARLGMLNTHHGH